MVNIVSAEEKTNTLMATYLSEMFETHTFVRVMIKHLTFYIYCTPSLIATLHNTSTGCQSSLQH